MSDSRNFLSNFLSRREALKGLGGSFLALTAAVGLGKTATGETLNSEEGKQPVEAKLHPAAVARNSNRGGRS